MAKRKGRKNDYYGADTLRGNDEIIVAAFDTETNGLGGELLSIQWGIFGQISFDASDDKVANFYDSILNYPQPVVWFAHFAQYDWRYLMDHLLTLDLEFEVSMRNDHDIYQITITREDGKRVTMRDSFALWGASLADLAKSFCPEIPKLEIDIEHFNVEDSAHVAYAKRDVEILLVGLPRLNAMLHQHFGIFPTATAAGSALKSWQKTLSPKERYNCSDLNAEELFIRQAYYGGLVFLTDTRTHADCETYDINSSYPSAMEQFGVPYGRTGPSSDYLCGKPGIYRCRVRAPDDLRVPIIPARNEKGAMRWYRGEFDTVCTNAELIFAAQNGYEVIDIMEGIVFEEIVFPFSNFVAKCRALRGKFPSGTPENTLAKLMQNSCYGKFGSRRERMRVMPHIAMSEDDYLGASNIDDAGFWWTKKETDIDMRTLPQWAVFITAHARLRLLQTVYSVGVENVLYGDTDSVTVLSGHAHKIDVGPDYGQFKLEKTWRQFRAIAPKIYSGILMDGRFKGAAKGLMRRNLNDTHWRELLEDGATQAEALSLSSLRLCLKNGVKPAQILLRKSGTLENSQNYERLTNGDIRLKIRA